MGRESGDLDDKFHKASPCRSARGGLDKTEKGLTLFEHRLNFRNAEDFAGKLHAPVRDKNDEKSHDGVGEALFAHFKLFRIPGAGQEVEPGTQEHEEESDTRKCEDERN